MRACAHCRTRFEPWISSLQRGCSFDCLAALARKANERKAAAEIKAERKETTAKRKALEPISKLEKRAEAAVNLYVRLRDHHLGCCSCDKPATWGGRWNASHLRSVGAASSIRYNLWNIAKSCSQCNNHLSGNIGEYLPRAITRMGQERIDWLYAQNAPVRRTREYLERLATVFNKKARRAKRRLGVL